MSCHWRFESQRPALNDIVHEKRGITADTALRLSRYFGTTSRFWMNMQASCGVGVGGGRTVPRAERINAGVCGTNERPVISWRLVTAGVFAARGVSCQRLKQLRRSSRVVSLPLHRLQRAGDSMEGHKRQQRILIQGLCLQVDTTVNRMVSKNAS